MFLLYSNASCYATSIQITCLITRCHSFKHKLICFSFLQTQEWYMRYWFRLILWSEGTYFKVPRCLIWVSSPYKHLEAGILFIDTTHWDLTLTPHLLWPTCVVMTSSPHMSSVLRVMRVFAYADIHTITTRRVSWFLHSNPLPIFQDSWIYQRGWIIMLRVLYLYRFFHSGILILARQPCVSDDCLGVPVCNAFV